MRDTMLVTYRGTVYPWRCDHMGHMNVMWYAGKFDEASWQLLATLGFSPGRFRRDGSGMVALEQRIEYKRELHDGGCLTISAPARSCRGMSRPDHAPTFVDEPGRASQ